MADPSMVTVGQVVRPHGIKGQVVVAPETDFGSERFAAGATLHCVRDGQPSTLAIAASFPHQGRWVVGFVGVTSMNEAEQLRGLELFIPAVELRPLGEGVFYAHDLAGCAVTDCGRHAGRRSDGGSVGQWHAAPGRRGAARRSAGSAGGGHLPADRRRGESDRDRPARGAG